MSDPYGARPPEAQPVTTTHPVAGMDRRFQAFAVDRLLEALVVGSVGVAVWLALDEVGPVVWACLGTGAVLWLVMAVVLGVSGTSPGKAMVGLRVVHHGTGTPIGVGPALLRSLVLLVCGIPTFGIGLATLAWTAVEDRGRERRGLHDHWASSVVVDERPRAVQAGSVADDQPRHVVNLTAMRLVPAPPAPAVAAPPRTHTSEHTGSRQSFAPAAASSPEHPRAVPPPPGLTAPPQHGAPQPGTARQGAPQPGAHRGAPQSQPQPQPQAQPAAHQSQPAAHQSQPAAHRAPSRPATVPPPPDQAPPMAPPAQPYVPRPPAVAAPGGPPPQAAAARWRADFDDGQSFVVVGTVLVGRRPEPRNGEVVAHVVPLTSADMSVSKTHAQFGPVSDGAMVVMDRGSTNGTVVVRRGAARKLAPGRPATVLDGDELVFGDRKVTLRREA